jgi:class 3 adenylate cyclase
MVHHVHVLLAGQFGARLVSGDEAIFVPGDVFDIPPGHDAWVVGEEAVELLDISGHVADFGEPSVRARVVATLLLTDIVGSTSILARVGDAAWKQLLGDHDRILRSEIQRAGGREVDTTGDGFLAEFGSAAAALECALRASTAIRNVGLEVRVGVHTGEIERVGDNVRGLAVHTTARVMAAAGASEIVTTAVTRLLSEGGAFTFESRGEHSLKGLPAPVELFSVGAS